jgi:pyruvate formate lyase activating enzyme
MKQGTLFDIKRFALHDGPGIRTTVFLKGCPMRCWWCHNPESMNPVDSDGVGERKTAKQVMREIEKEVIFYDESGGGVTFSGGEPMMQAKFLEVLLDNCKEKEIHTALDTTGCVPPRMFESLAEKADLFLYDLKIIDNSQHMKYTGTSNEYVLENLKSLSRKGKKVIIRFPLIPGVTDTEQNLIAVAEFVSGLEGIRDIEVLPYHKTAADKYRRLKMKDKMKGVTPPGARRIREVKEIFKRYGLNVLSA